MSRTPSAFVRSCLTDLMLDAGEPFPRLRQVLARIGEERFYFTLQNSGVPLDDWTNATDALARAGLLTLPFLEALSEEPALEHRAEAIDQIRVDAELAPADTAVLSRPELAEAKAAARAGGLHDGARHSQLRIRLPREVASRAAGVVNNPADQLDAWFDAANRQVVGGGDSVWMDGLLQVAAALADGAGRPRLLALRDRLGARAFGGAPTEARAAELEQVVRELGIMVDAAAFVSGMARSLARVCLVRVGGQDMGTGFLVGDDLLLTNHHVLAGVLGDPGRARDVSFVFDFRTVDGRPQEGPTVGLAGGATPDDPAPWLVDATPATDTESDPVRPGSDFTQPIDTDHLDFALVRLDAPIGATQAPNGEVRRHFVLAPAGPPYGFPKGAALAIVGHPVRPGVEPPRCMPQVFAIEPDSVIGVNPNGTRVRYRTNTLRGNSGSPVLSASWDLVALHHFGQRGEYNQGIPISAIAARPAVRAALSARAPAPGRE